VTDLASAVKDLLRERAVTLGAVGRKGWGLVVIERADELAQREVLKVAQRSLSPWLWARPVGHR
jgi:hypothetical protein